MLVSQTQVAMAHDFFVYMQQEVRQYGLKVLYWIWPNRNARIILSSLTRITPD